MTILFLFKSKRNHKDFTKKWNFNNKSFFNFILSFCLVKLNWIYSYIQCNFLFKVGLFNIGMTNFIILNEYLIIDLKINSINLYLFYKLIHIYCILYTWMHKSICRCFFNYFFIAFLLIFLNVNWMSQF